MANMNFITDRLAVGGDCGWGDELPANIADLVDAGITHVIDMRKEYHDIEAFKVYAPGITYHWVPMDDRGQTEGTSTWQKVWLTAQDALIQPDTKVLVHCHMGVNRGPSAALAILMGLGYRLDQALTMIREARPEAAIAYWMDVVRWYVYQHRHGVDRLLMLRREGQRWHRENPHATSDIIRGIRAKEGGTIFQ